MLATLFIFAALSGGGARMAQAATAYGDETSFREAAGSGVATETFDEFADNTVLSDRIPGLVFFSNNEGASSIRAALSAGAVSSPNLARGGIVSDSPGTAQNMVVYFLPDVHAVGFYLAGYMPGASPATVRVVFQNETSATYELINTSGSETTPVFFGIISSDLAIFQIETISGFFNGAAEEFGIDDLIYGDVGDEVFDRIPPVCTAFPSREEGVDIIGTASDDDEGDSGLESVELQPGSTNLSLVITSDFTPGADFASFRVFQTVAGSDAQGTVVATDRGGNSCTVPASFRFVSRGAVNNKTLCTDGRFEGSTLTGASFLLSVTGTSTADDSAICSAALPTFGEIATFPPGYEPAPDPCRMLDIDSPIHGLTHMVLKKDGDFDERLRLLFSESSDPFTDITDTVEEISQVTPDPTRITGTISWSPVRVTCGILSESTRSAYCSTHPDPPDTDHDTFTLCGSTPDCNDQRGFIHPGAPERCNGMDDDCDGARDEGHPTLDAGQLCTVIQDSPGHPPLKGACLQGATSCASGPMTCVQTVFPVREVGCNGVDDNCDGVDEAYFFDYLAPIKTNGERTVFLKKRGAIPVKFQLHDCAGRAVTSARATIEVHLVDHGVIDDDAIDIVAVGQANVDNLYRVSGSQYVYNLNASFLQSNSYYVIRTLLDDGTMHDVTIGIK